MTSSRLTKLGRHRLLHGDATNPHDIAELTAGYNIDLVFTDPPWGLNIVKNGGRFKRWRDQIGNMKGDEDASAARAHYEIVKDMCDHIIIWGGDFFTDFLPPSGAWLFWDKIRPKKFSFSDGELAWKSWGHKKKCYRYYWNGAFGIKNTKLDPVPHVHPCQKPVNLLCQILEDWTNPGDIVLDCFGGSGSLLLACELTDRTCLMMELDRNFCDIIIDRYHTLTEGMIDFAEYDS